VPVQNDIGKNFSKSMRLNHLGIYLSSIILIQVDATERHIELGTVM